LDIPTVRRSLVGDSSPARWHEWFTVAVDTGAPPMLGDYSLWDERAYFRPRFPLVPGKRYLVSVSRAGEPSHFPIVVPPAKLPPPATVTAVYPSGDRLPENLLRIYLHFGGPMRRGDVYDFIRLLGPDGKPVASPFVTLGEELWNDDGARLTLLLDPGRQKHDLLPRQQAGPVLEAGKSYTLVISADIRDAHDRPIGKEFRKRLDAVAPETRPIQPADWKITSPAAGGREPLTVTFDRSLDDALLKRLLTVADSGGKPVEGDVTTTDAETRWRFVPRQPWAAGQYALVADPVLEDVCGNRVGRAFEVDEDRTEAQPAAPVRRPFVVEAR
jgi:hypothetical protein